MQTPWATLQAMAAKGAPRPTVIVPIKKKVIQFFLIHERNSISHSMLMDYIPAINPAEA